MRFDCSVLQNQSSIYLKPLVCGSEKLQIEIVDQIVCFFFIFMTNKALKRLDIPFELSVVDSNVISSLIYY